MKVTNFTENQREDWLFFRRGKITGSRLKDVITKRGTGRKIGFYELIAEKLGLPPDEHETAMARGSRLEADALDRFEQESGKTVDRSLLIWQRDDDENIAVSPDGVISETEAVEVKCLSSARHIEAYLTKKIPADYHEQALQYFAVNDKLETLHFVFYDPRFAEFAGKKGTLGYFEITLTRQEMQAQVDEILTAERQVIAEVNAIVNELTF